MSDESQGSRRNGYWSGMPTNLKARAIGWTVYYVAAAAIFTQNAILGIALMVVPGLWFVLKNWVISEFGGNSDPERKITLSGYTIRHLWNASLFTRGVMAVTGLGVILFGLGWISTEEMRIEAAKPTLTERVTGAASGAVAATKEKTGRWVETAKGWFD